jgi:3-methyladenine DNA glycosylase/8-oxoguanine DNA glycosylase
MLAPFVEIDDSRGLSCVAQLGSGQVVDVRIYQSGDAVAVQAGDGLSAAEQAEVAGVVAWMLGLDQDFTPFYELARQEPKLAHAAGGAKGRILRSPTVFEDVVKTILTTNTTWSGTIRMNKALVELYGAPLPDDPARKAFPTAERLAAVDGQELRAAAGLGYRGPYVAGLAQAIAAGALDLEALKTADLSSQELRKRLLGIKGVGDYAAANLLMLLGHYDYLPVDSWALRLVSHEWHGGRPISRSEVEAAFESWGRWKGLAFWVWDWSYTG